MSPNLDAAPAQPSAECGPDAKAASMEIASAALQDGITLVRLAGVLDLLGAQEIDLQMSVLTQTRGHLIIDLAGVTYMASMGLRRLMHAARSVHQRGFRLVLVGPVESVGRVLRSTGVDAVMPIYPTIAEAEAALTQ